jgi:SAM-dependent methyltransferase
MSFGAIAGDYDRLRPDPPDAAISWLLPPHCETAVDLAAGTGKLSRALARRVGQVIAVEPDPRMAAVLRARSPQIQVVQGRGEATGLDDAIADGVFISSAWHWLDPERALPEIGRVLRDGGRFGAIWTSRDRQVDWVREVDHLRKLSRAGSRPGDAQDEARDEAHRPGHREVTLPDDSLFHRAEKARFEFSQAMTVDEIAGMMATYSGAIAASQEDRAAALRRTRSALRERFGDAGQVSVPMRSWCWRADRQPRDQPRTR